jgi:hypothetical protein
MTHALHNELNRKCLKILLEELFPIYTAFTIEFHILLSLSITQKRMVLEKLLPLGVEDHLESNFDNFDSPPVERFLPLPFTQEYDEFPNYYLPTSIIG